jgi:hypothetical protein
MGHWLRMPKPSTAYAIQRDWRAADRAAYLRDALAAADPEVDFSRYDIVYFVADPDAPGVDSDATKVVNLERPLRADARVGGHFVQGHVDATGTIEDVRQEGDSRWLTVTYPPALAPLIVRKGSIAVNGISLTIAGADGKRFDVQIIPFTWTNTNLRHAKPADVVNIECDILGKYVVHALGKLGVAG